MSSPDDLMPEALRLRRRAARLEWLLSQHAASACPQCAIPGGCAEKRYLAEQAITAANMAGLRMVR